MDFALAMLVVLTVTGAIMALDGWVWAPARRRAAGLTRTGNTEAIRKAGKEPVVVEYARRVGQPREKTNVTMSRKSD